MALQEVHRVRADHGGFTGVANCAGVSTLARVVDHDAAEWRRVVDVCLTGASSSPST